MNHLPSRARVFRVAKRIGALVAMTALLSWNVQSALAAALTTPRDYLNRQKASQTTGIQHEVFFTVSSGGTITNGKVKLIFPDADDGLWCRTAGSDLVATQIQNPTGATESASASTIGTLAGSCAQGAGASSYDTIVVTFTGTISNSTKYGLRISDGSTGKLGTAGAGNDIKVTVQTTTSGDAVTDSATYALSLIADDQVVVTATVDPTLTVALSANSAALGTLSTSNVNQAGITSTVSTNASGGYVSLVKYDATLTSGLNTISDTAGGTIVAGTSEYGVSTSDSSVDVTTWSPTACSTTATTSNASALTTTFQSFASGAAAISGDATTLCFLASTTALQAPGTYTSTATLVTTAKF